MPSSFHSGRQLPGWGSELRKLPTSTRRTALVLATFAGLAISGCSGNLPAAPTPTSNVSVASQPVHLKGALELATRHLDVMPRAASHPFHLVAFRGKGLDENGNTTASAESGWEFTFSRYAEELPSQKYEVVTVALPGAGASSLAVKESEDATLSPIEHWDGAKDGASPDSFDLVAPLKASGVATAGATISFSQGMVKVEASGKSVTYDTAERQFSPVQ